MPLRVRASPNNTGISVPIHFHVVSRTADIGNVTHAMVANQFGRLQQSYAPVGISFTLASVDWTVHDDWATDADDQGMKNVLHKGRYQDLNVYFQTALSYDGSGGLAAQLLGYCTLPTNVTYIPCRGCTPQEFPVQDWVGDGCNVHAGSMPGGWLDGYNLGKTAVHEVGHWFGLLHTFQDTTCSLTDPGDYINDTPQQSTASQGCPTGKNSCPGSPGMDAIHNYMDYSDDACYARFSPQQMLRMQGMFNTLRKGH
jgi:Pregnancy-associated plasma protein-A